MKEPDFDQYPHFSRSEMACKHTGEAFMDETFMERLEDLRVKFGKPMKITSAYRSPSHPAEAKKAMPGAHSTGRAVDVAVSHNDAYTLMRMAMGMGFTGIGVAQKGNGRFLHLDDVTSGETFASGKKFNRPIVWSY